MFINRLYAVVILSLAAFPPSARAEQVGNGGSIVRCDRAGRPPNFSTLDVYEGLQRNQILDLGSPSLEFDQKLEIALGRLHTFDPARARQYRDRVAFFLANAAFRNNIRLERIPDNDPIVLDEGCIILQAVVRRPVIGPSDQLFIVDNDLWNKLDKNNRVALALHEVIYEEALTKAGHRTSARSRYFNSLLLSGSIDQFTTTRDYIDFLGSTMGFSLYEQRGVLADVNEIDFYDGGQIKSFKIRGTSEVSPFTYDAMNVALSSNFSKAYFYRNGNLACLPNVRLRDPVWSDHDTEIMRNETLALLSFHENGHLLFVSMTQGSRFKLRDGRFFVAPYSTNSAGVQLDDQGYFYVLKSNAQGGEFPPLASPCGE